MTKKYHCALLVDDDPVSCFINKEILSLSELAHHSHAAYNGEEALEFIEKHCELHERIEHCPDLIFLDLNMPVMDGFAFLDTFSKLNLERKEEIEVIILTSSTNHLDIERVKKYQVKGYINKPLTKENLAAVLAL